MDTTENHLKTEEPSSSRSSVNSAGGNTSDIHFLEESVAEIVVPSTSHIEDNIPLENNEMSTNFYQPRVDNPGPSTSRTSHNETSLASSVARDTTASNNDSPAVRPSRILRVIAEGVPGGAEESSRLALRYVDLKYVLIRKKLDFLRLKRKNLVKEFGLRMKLLRNRMTIEEKKLLIIRKKFRRR